MRLPPRALTYANSQVEPPTSIVEVAALQAHTQEVELGRVNWNGSKSGLNAHFS